MSNWLVWCDGNGETGLGHLARCLGYAEALKKSGHRVQLAGDYSTAAKSMIAMSGIESIPHPAIKKQFSDPPQAIFGAEGLLVDSYALSSAELSVIKKKIDQRPVLILDDFAGLDSYPCDGIINFTIGAIRRKWNNASGVKKFLGTKYFPAREWMRTERRRRRKLGLANLVPKREKRILIAPGGTDKAAVTYQIVRALLSVAPNSHLSVCLPDQAESRNETLNLLSYFREPQIFRFLPNLSENFRDADVCLCGGGLTKYEGAFSGLPVASLDQTPGQHDDTINLAEQGIGFNLGFAPEAVQSELENRLDDFLHNRQNLLAQVENGMSKVGTDAPSAAVEPFISVISKAPPRAE